MIIVVGSRLGSKFSRCYSRCIGFMMVLRLLEVINVDDRMLHRPEGN